LGNPPPGAGLLINTLVKMNYRLFPVGFYATAETCHLNFGKPLKLNIRKYLDNDKIDRKVSQRVMQSIAELVPESLRDKSTKE
jgi:hypothetical protein